MGTQHKEAGGYIHVVEKLSSRDHRAGWSGDGQHLAAGMVNGTVTIITFPALLFK